MSWHGELGNTSSPKEPSALLACSVGFELRGFAWSQKWAPKSTIRSQVHLTLWGREPQRRQELATPLRAQESQASAGVVRGGGGRSFHLKRVRAQVRRDLKPRARRRPPCGGTRHTEESRVCPTSKTLRVLPASQEFRAETTGKRQQEIFFFFFFGQ